MSKYMPLYTHLKHQTGDRIHMTFSDIERIISEALPKSASKYREWWANDRTHSHAHAWMNAGYNTAEVNMSGRRLVFRK